MYTYLCKECNYTTSKQANYKRHLTSKKHTKKVSMNTHGYVTPPKILSESYEMESNKNCKSISDNDNLICTFCKQTFTRSDNLKRHLKRCNDNEQAKLKDINKELENENKILKIQVQHYSSEKKHYVKENDYYKQLVMEAGTIVKKSMSTLSYAMNNYENAPDIKTITLDDIIKHEPDNIKLAEYILSAYKRKTLPQYLGDIIINLYKKTNPKKQSLWNTDDSRYTYILKELLGDTSNWIIDKKGVKTTKYIINPLVVHVRKLLEDYNKATDLSDLKSNKEKMDILIENSRALLDLVNDIDNKILEKDILKYISAYLRFNDLKKLN